MRVLQVLYSGMGGHGSVAFSLQAEARSQAAWSGSMVFLGIEPLLPEYARLCHEFGIQHRYVPAIAGSPWRSWQRLYLALDELRPEAIILHSVKTILPCWWYSRSRSIPIVAVEHQNNDLKKRSEIWVSRLLMVLADAIVVLTDEYRDALRQAVGLAWRSDKVNVIANGIDTTVFSPPVPVKVDFEQPRRIGMAARFSATKRHELLIGALSILIRRDGPEAWRLSLAGDGDTLTEVASLARAQGLERQVELPGYLGAQALCDWFHSLDIYAHASDGETLSTSILQAMAMRLPIVGSNVPGINSLLSAGGGCGLLPNDQTAEAFADELALLVDHPGLSESLGERARTFAAKEFGQDVMFTRYQELLRSCKKLST